MIKQTLLPVLTVLACFAHDASAAETFPNRPIRLLVGFTPGGAADVSARVITRKMSESLGVNIVVENRPGAGGNIAAEIVATANPNGYTLYWSSVGPLTVSPALGVKLPYDPLTDFAPISMGVQSCNVLSARPGFPANTLAEFIAEVKKKPDIYTYASAGAGSTTHVSSMLFLKSAGLQMIHVPYRGVGPAFTDMFAGNVQMLSASPVELMPHVDSKKVKPLGISSKTRSRHLPNVPTISETLPAPFVATYNGILAPKETPREIVAVISKAIVDAVKAPEFSDKLLKVGVEPSGTTPEEMARTIAADKESWLAVKDDLAAAMKQQ